MSVRGFILDATYRIESGKAVVHLYGKLESGQTFLVRDSRMVPYFYVRAADAQAAAALGAGPLLPADKVNLAGEPVVRVGVRTPPDTPPLRDRLLQEGIPCYEADIRFALRYLIDKGLRGALGISGTPQKGSAFGVDLLFADPDLQPAELQPRLSVLSFDIETDPRGRRLLSIALHMDGGKAGPVSEVLLFNPAGYFCPPGAVPFVSERDVLRAFCQRVGELDPDILTGWNVIDFDLMVLARLGEQLGVPLQLSRGPGTVRVQPSRFRWGTSRAGVPGRVVLDGIQLLRGAFIQMEEYGLDFVAREVLGEGKALGPGAQKGRAHEILRLFKEDRAHFVEYNRTDARLCLDILRKLQLIELSVERSLLTGMPLDRVNASIASFDFLYLSELSRRGVVGPTLSEDSDAGEPTAGGHVLSPLPGLYGNVLVFDFRSLYPSLIRTFQIDPLGYLPRADPGEPDPIVAPSGARFRRRPGILPQLLDDLFPRRAAAQQAGDRVRSHAIKILMNSFYGVLGTSACRFHNAEVANAITSFGREVLLWTKARIEAEGYQVLYGDTDSLFVRSGQEDPVRARRAGEELARVLNRDLSAYIERTYRVKSRLELEFQTLYLRLLLPHLRGGGAEGARKRYAGLCEKDGKPVVVFTGLEAVRRDWTALARQVQRELYERLFSDREVAGYLRQVIKDLRAGRLDDLLRYRKALRKDLSAYTQNTPPHVAAARKMSGPAERLIVYLQTTCGPEPAFERQHPIDHEHYVQKQVRPVAEPVLSLLHLDFDKVIGDDTQLELF